MATVLALWLPILVSAVLVFIASNVLWMALPFWHRRDYGRLPNPQPILDALSGTTSGQYIVPWVDWKTMTPEQRLEIQTKPAAYMLVRNPARFSFGKALTFSLLHTLAVAVVVGYLTGRKHAAGEEFLEVFAIASTGGFLAYGFRSVSDAIWYGKPWKVAFKEMIDGVIYGVLMGVAFGWLWPL